MQSTQTPATRGRILAVDDCDQMGLLVQASLESFGYSVKVVANGLAALDAAGHEHFDAVVLDVDMPGLDGFAVGRALRNDPKTCSSVIAMHTSIHEAAVRCSFDQYDAYLPKPCSPQLIGECVDRLLQSRPALHTNSSQD
jgi:CheY-like chemotaxis protein